MLLMLAMALAQSGRRLPSRNQGADETIRLRAEEVLLNVTVIDPYGRQATDLRKDEFIIAEDGIRQQIAGFATSYVPVSVVILLDGSGSVAGQIESLRTAAIRFVKELGPEDKVSIIEFHATVELIQDWTSNRDDLLHAISWRFRPGMIRTKEGRSIPASTSLYDALYLAAQEQLTKVRGRKAIILLTDGLDTSSKVTYDQALAAVIRSNAVVYVVSKARYFINEANRLRGPLGRILGGGAAADSYVAQMEQAERLMSNLAARTGGQILSPLEDKDLEEAYGRIARELKNQYVITYVPKNEERDGRLRRIQVFLTRPGYTARTRDSYYAPQR